MLAACLATQPVAASQVGWQTAGCAATVQVTHLAFHPRSVEPGQTSTARLQAVNCSGTTQDVRVSWIAHWVAAGGGTGGCPIIDPLSQAVQMPPHSVYRSSLSYLVPPQCGATTLELTVSLSKQAQVIAQRTAALDIDQR